MSATLLEVTRSKHEEVERLERLIVKDLQNEPASSHARLCQNHRVRRIIAAITSSTKKLVEIYEDFDSARKDEIAALGGQTETGGTNLFGNFYDSLKEIREYHRKRPTSLAFDVYEESDQKLLKEEPDVVFSGEEGRGRYLDLHEMHNRYVNLDSADESKRIEYATYLDVFSKPEEISCKLKLTKQYKEYLEHMLGYLISFVQRKEPLQDLERLFARVETDYQEVSKGLENRNVSSQDSIDLVYFSTVRELIEVGRENLKKALAALGLKSGGTDQQLHFVAASQDHTELREIGLKESKMKRLCELLSETIDETKENVQRKQTLAVSEWQKELEDDKEQVDVESDDEEQQIYNPLNLPTGVDGKPIPYWLYKLHGLGQEFKCEICGNQTYRGRRAFEQHFKELCHQSGMRRLGIPNTKNFNEITSIQEAIALWEKIQARKEENKWCPDREEEYEDMDGNIYDKKTYTDFRRQGLI
ncbi:hypothetical protein MKW94_014125 [Papaver nudicaule]|uniref:Splicing factor 3A subunit 3 n=1 Tax=Papaver nudicaule TaxID=74823 RepID=A0AA41RQG5_PAPNU|nr:hypothetical protein [Papaver nudicaule]